MVNRAEMGAPISARPNNSWARYVTTALAVWLLFSTFIWRHTNAQRVNVWVVGVLMLVISLVAVIAPRARFGNSALAVWLVLSTAAYGGYAATVVNNLIVGALVFGLSMIPTGRRPGATFPPPTH